MDEEEAEACTRIKRKLQCAGDSAVTEKMLEYEVAVRLERRTREAAGKPTSVIFLQDQPNVVTLRSRVLTERQNLNSTGQLRDMAVTMEAMSGTDGKEYMLEQVWPVIRDLVASAYLLETRQGDELKWGIEKGTETLSYIGKHGVEEAKVRPTLGKAQASPGASNEVTLATAFLYAIRYSAPAKTTGGTFLNTGLGKGTKPEELFNNTEHLVRVGHELLRRIHAMLEPVEDVRRTKAFESKVGIGPAALLAIVTQLCQRAEAFEELKERNTQRGGKAPNEAEQRKQLRKVLQPTRATLRMGSYTMLPEAGKEEQRLIRDHKRDLESQRQSDALVSALQRSSQGQGGGGGGGEATKKRKIEHRAGTGRVKLCLKCGVEGHKWRGCEAQSILEGGALLTFKQANYITSTSGFDVTVQHAAIPEMEGPLM